MQIILKFLIKNIQEKKFRTGLILMAIILSTALFFASNAVSRSFSDTIVNQMKSTYGQADIVVEAKDDAVSPWISESIVRDNPDIELVMGVNSTVGVYDPDHENVSFTLFGADLDKLQKINPYELLQKTDFEKFTGKEIIVSQDFSETYHMAAGDMISLKLQNVTYRFRIVGIAAPSTLFGNESQNRFALVPKDTLEQILDTGGKSSALYVKTTPGTDTKALVAQLSPQLKPYHAKAQEAVNAADIQQRLSSISIPFMMISILVLIMSVFIIFTSFKVIMVERLPILGTFRSIGATEKMTRNVLLWESTIYGLIGGSLGVPLGMGILSAMLKVISGANPKGLKMAMAIQPGNVMGSFILALVISLASAYIPIRKASRLPLKDVVLGTIEQAKSSKGKKMILGVSLFVLSVILPYVVPYKLVTPIGGLCIFTLVTSVLFIVPLLVKALTGIFERLYGWLLGNEGILAVKNIKGNDNINQNIGLLALSISTLLLVSVLSTTMESLITNEAQGAKYQVVAMGEKIDKAFVGRIQAVKGVDKVYPVYQAAGAKIKETGENLGAVQGVNTNINDMLDFFDVRMQGDKDVLPYLAELQEDRNLLVKDSVLQKFNLAVGDSITLETPKGNRAYHIIGVMTAAPSDIMAGASYLKADFSLTDYGFAYIQSASPNEAVKEIKNLFGDKRNYTATLEESVTRMKSMFGMLFGIMQGFSYVLMLIGIFGIINNLIINFVQRRRAIAMYKSVGMSGRQLTKMTIVEAFTGGIFGGIFGVGTAILELEITKKIMSASIGIVPMEYPVQIFITSFILGVLITLIGSISPLLKGQKLQIIEAIKFE